LRRNEAEASVLEIEQRYVTADLGGVEAQLRAWGAAELGEEAQADHYFNAPDRDFVRTDEAFRLRRAGADNFLTYKGPKRQAAVKTRFELEVPLPPGDEAAQEIERLLVRLGYRPVVVVRKKRRSFRVLRDGLEQTVCLDEVADVGTFVEVEALAPEDETGRIGAALTATAAALGLTQVERRSYLAMTLEAQARKRAAPVADAPGSPVVARTLPELKQALVEVRRRRQTVGLVPTMGALHEGHLSLIRAARTSNEVVVVSVFVNPTQFGPHEDLERYPRPFADDLALCAACGADVVFAPEPATMYPPGFLTAVEVTKLQDVLEGAARPGHFRGVCTVVLKLFNLVQPDRAYFGQKDGQQALIVRRMVEDLNVPVEVVVLPTVREPDGLALSSRNRYLDANQRQQAAVLSQALRTARDRAAGGERSGAALRRALEEVIAQAPEAALEYAAVVDAGTLTPVDQLSGPTLLALAVKFGGTRLIDNVLLQEKG
jgi:pantoate--beta-alanine ligase